MKTTKPQAFDPHRNDFRRKLGYYLTGLAIGLFILGGFHVLKRVMAGKGPQGQNAPAGQAGPAPQAGPANQTGPAGQHPAGPANDQVAR